MTRLNQRTLYRGSALLLASTAIGLCERGHRADRKPARDRAGRYGG